jgi:hypothetical protein
MQTLVITSRRQHCFKRAINKTRQFRHILKMNFAEHERVERHDEAWLNANIKKQHCQQWPEKRIPLETYM